MDDLKTDPVSVATKERVVVELPAISAQQFLYLIEKTGMTKTQLVILAVERLYASVTAEQAA